VPIYFADPLARRSLPLQKTRDARAPKAWMNGKLLQQLGLAAGAKVRVSGNAILDAAQDDRLPDQCVRIAAGHPSTAGIGAMFGAVTLEKVSSQQAA
jgi:NADH-quinone oxidoreductase subunit G